MKNISHSRGIVVIHVDALRREITSAWLLANKLKSEGFKVILTSRITTRHFLRFCTPDIFIASYVFTLDSSELHRLAEENTLIYINEVEGTDHEDGVSTTYPDVFNHEKLDYKIFAGVFTWNEYSRKWLIENRCLHPTDIHASGSIRQSKYSKRQFDRSKTIGILSRFEIINTFDGRHPFSNLLDINPEDHRNQWYFDRCAIDSEAFAIVCQIIEKIIDKGRVVSMRPHPNENPEPYNLLKKRFGFNFQVDDSYTINEWLEKVCVVIGTTSTGFVEPYIAGIPIITISDILTNKYRNNAVATLLDNFDLAAYKPENIEIAAELCLRENLIPKISKPLDSFLNSFYNLNTVVDPVDTIANVIKQQIKTNNRLISIYKYITALILVHSLDLLTVIIALSRLRPSLTFNLLKNYHYNRFIHSPSLLMRSFKNKFEKVRLLP